MDYFHTDDPRTINYLIAVLTTAEAHGQRVRIAVEGHDLKVKRGEGMWSPPLTSSPDPYRDLRTERPLILST